MTSPLELAEDAEDADRSWAAVPAPSGDAPALVAETPKAEGPTTAKAPAAAAPKEASRRKRRREIPGIDCSFLLRARFSDHHGLVMFVPRWSGG
jgi:hypothetical protein